MHEFLIGLLIGITASGVIRLSFGRFVIYTSERGWVWRWSRFDEEDQRIKDMVNAAFDDGFQLDKDTALSKKVTET